MSCSLARHRVTRNLRFVVTNIPHQQPMKVNKYIASVVVLVFGACVFAACSGMMMK